MSWYLEIYYSLLFLLLVHMHSLETMISMVDCILLSYFSDMALAVMPKHYSNAMSAYLFFLKG